MGEWIGEKNKDILKNMLEKTKTCQHVCDGKNVYLKAGILISVLGIWGVYVLCLKQIPLYEPFASWNRGDYWMIYLIEVIWMVATGFILAMAGKACAAGKKRGTFLLLSSGAILISFAAVSLMWGNVLWQWKKLLISLWPFILYVTANIIKRKSDDLKRSIKGLVCYYLVVFVFIWILEIKLVFSEFYRREPLETLYLFMMAIAVWAITKTKEDLILNKAFCAAVPEKEEKIKKTAWVILPIVAFIILFWGHDRILNILGSFRNSITSISSMETDVNWLGYRLALLFNGRQGDFSLMEERFAAQIPVSCPLVWVNYVKGSVAAFFILTLEMLLLFCIISLIKKEKVQKDRNLLSRIVLAALISRCILGILADMFLITSSDIGVPLLRNPGDIIMIIYVLLLDDA